MAAVLWKADLSPLAAPAPAVDGAPRQQAVAMRQFSADEWARHREQGQRLTPSSPRPPARRAPERAKEPERPPEGKVVATAPGNGERPSDSKFLSETDNRVDRETIARQRRTDYKSLAPKPAGPLPAAPQGRAEVPQMQIAGNDGQGSDDAPKRDGGGAPAIEIPRQEARPEQRRLSFEGLSGVPLRFEDQRYAEALAGNSSRLRLSEGQGQGGERSLGKRGAGALSTLMPSAAVLGRIAGAPAADVSREDGVEEGEGTYLNTREWKHASFFNRVKQSVGQHWDPNALIALQDPTGEAYLYKDRHTLVAVTLDAEGGLKSIRVTRPSGVEFLDREAMDAFRRAGPFPHPPTALQNDRGEISFSFGFYLEVNRSRLRLFR